ncbi:hypothetical protein C7405_10196 [Paraburkholderia caballeronis]|nr:hypothetical protein C7405_10196 [Paraburkholderia caballeronis]
MRLERMSLPIFVDLDCAAERVHHRANIGRHVGHAIAGLVVPVAEETHSCGLLVEQVRKVGAWQANEVLQMGRRVVAPNGGLATDAPNEGS